MATQRPGGEHPTRTLHFILIIDCSASMAGEKMRTVNHAIRDDLLPKLNMEAVGGSGTRILVRAIRFSDRASWHVAQPTEPKDLAWTDLTAGGPTAMGAAMRMAAEALKVSNLGERSLPPVLVLLSDGQPTDDYVGGLEELMAEPWAARAVRLAIAIGKDADLGALRRFTGNEGRTLLHAAGSAELVTAIRWTSTATLQSTSTVTASTPVRAAGTDGGENVPIPEPPPPTSGGGPGPGEGDWSGDGGDRHPDVALDEPVSRPAGRIRGRGDEVECAVFAPPQARPGEDVLIQAFAFLTGQESEAEAEARRNDEEAVRRGITTLDVLLSRGQVLRFHLALSGLAVVDAVRDLTWRGRSASVQFGVPIPADRLAGNLVGTLLVSTDGVPAGRIDFKLTVVPASPGQRRGEPARVGESASRFRKAFVSYASADRPEVLRRVQMLRRPLTDIEVFQDVLDLEPGEAYEPLLYRRIDECDIFLLFWSGNARRSDWVRRELEHALRRQGPDGRQPPTILPVIIEGPPPPAPPPELAHLHFNDYLLYLAR